MAVGGGTAGERLGPPTIADVAARAGVGEATVSRVFNGHPNVADPTRERVLAAIRELDYRPSSVARNLSLRCTFVIGVVVPFFTNPSAVERLRGIVAGLEASPYDLALFDVESPDRQRRAFDTFGRGDRAAGPLPVPLEPGPHGGLRAGAGPRRALGAPRLPARGNAEPSCRAEHRRRPAASSGAPDRD